jgi:hypothetical protein
MHDVTKEAQKDIDLQNALIRDFDYTNKLKMDR